MRIVVNLASEPFIELRPLYVRLRLWMLLLAVLAIPLGLLLRMEQRRAADADARMQALDASIQKIQSEQAGFQSMMRQPQNAAVLSQSDFLNQLFARKAFSWTAVMMDLESVLPAGVQVLNLDPIIAPNGHVTIRMRVAGPRERTVELVRNLEHSHRFVLPRLATESAESANNGAVGQGSLQPVSATTAVDFDILADYNPLPNKNLLAAQSGTPAPVQAPAHGKHTAAPKSPRPASPAAGKLAPGQLAPAPKPRVAGASLAKQPSVKQPLARPAGPRQPGSTPPGQGGVR